MTDLPAGSPLPGTTGTGRRDVVSVAELLARHTSPDEHARRAAAGPLTGPVLSVGDLLRREGRAGVPAGAAGDWPDIDLPRPRPAAGAAPSREWPDRPTTGRRRTSAVAGVLVAAGSVLAAALYNGAASHGSDARAADDGLFPGIGLPGGSTPPDTLPAGYLPATVALDSPLAELPPTAPGADGWMDLAFPRQRAGGPAAATLRNASAGPGPAAAIPPQRGGPPRSGPTGTGSALGDLPPVRAMNDPDRPAAGNLLDPAGGAAPSAGGTRTGPLQTATEVTRPAGAAVGGLAAPVARAAEPVGAGAGAALVPVTEAARPLTRALAPAARPVADTVEPVSTPVLGALSPVTAPVLEGTGPATAPVLRAAEPVTSLLDTSAQQDRPGAGPVQAPAVTDGTGPAGPVPGLGDTTTSLLGGR